MKKSPTLTVIQDDREKQPWTARYLGKDVKVVKQRLKTGDYTIKGIENLLTIERKRGWAEIAGNIATNVARRRFFAELDRMQTFPYRLLVVEDTVATIGTTRYRGYTGAKQVMDLLIRLPLEVGVPVLCVGARNYNQEVVRALFKHYATLRKEGRLYEY